MNTVQYQIDPPAGIAVVNAANSVVGLNSGSQATGVGVQLLDGTGAVFPLSVPGTANTAMTVTVTYRYLALEIASCRTCGSRRPNCR